MLCLPSSLGKSRARRWPHPKRQEAEESAPACATAESLGDIDESVDEAQGSGRASFGSQQGASHGASSKSDNPLEA